MRYLLDANVLVHLANRADGAGRIYDRLATLRKGQAFLSAITAHELEYMIARARVSKAHIAALEALLRRFPVEHFDLPAAAAAAAVRTELEAAGTPIGTFDALLAGHARRLGCVVVTDNEREFRRVRGLAVENWRR